MLCNDRCVHVLPNMLTTPSGRILHVICCLRDSTGKRLFNDVQEEYSPCAWQWTVEDARLSAERTSPVLVHRIVLQAT